MPDHHPTSRRPSILVPALAALTACSQPPVTAAPVTAAPVSATLAFVDATVFDGEAWSEHVTVLVDGDEIVALGPGTPVPEGATTIDAHGQTLLPGLIDGHTHVQAPGQLAAALMFGVTTEIDMFTLPLLARTLRAEQAETGAPHRADLVSAGYLATAPGGHGTEYGFEIPTLSAPGEAATWVDARLDEGSDFIKIVYDDGSGYDSDIPTLDRPTLEALIEASHARDTIAVVHIASQREAIEALRAGADGLAHLFLDEAPTPQFLEAARSGDAFVVGTLSVLFALCDGTRGAPLADDPRVRPWLSPPDDGSLRRGMPMVRAGGCQHAMRTTKQLHDAGVELVAGTDAPNPGTVHGASLHDELALLVEAGLPTAAALRAATSAPAAAFGLTDRGRIAPGQRADLVLVQGDPRRDIGTTRAIVGVWKAGVRSDRDAAAADIAQRWEEIEQARRQPPPEGLSEGSDPGWIADFEQPRPEARFGAGWQPSTDAMRGGKSTVTLTTADGALNIQGSIDGDGLPNAWAGAMFFPGPRPMAPTNLSSHPILRFRARGSGPLSVMLFAAQLGFMPSVRRVELTDAWTEQSIDLRELVSEPYDVSGLFFGGPPLAGPFEIQLDDVRLEPSTPGQLSP